LHQFFLPPLWHLPLAEDAAEAEVAKVEVGVPKVAVRPVPEVADRPARCGTTFCPALWDRHPTTGINTVADHDQATVTTTSPNIMTENRNTKSRNITTRNPRRAKKDATDAVALLTAIMRQ